MYKINLFCESSISDKKYKCVCGNEIVRHRYLNNNNKHNLYVTKIIDYIAHVVVHRSTSK